MMTFPRCSTCGHREATRQQITDAIMTAVDTHGEGWSSIAHSLNDQKIPTFAAGSTWWPSSVQAIYRSAKKLKADGFRWERHNGKWAKVAR